MIELIKEQLLSNELLTGGAILGSAGLLIRWIMPQIHRFLWWLRNRFIVSVTVTDEFKQFKWVSYWIAEHPYSSKAKRVSFDSFIKKTKGGQLMASVAPGMHLLWHNRRPLIVHRVMDKLQMKGGDFDSSSIRHEWELSILGSRAYVDKLFEEMRECYIRNTEKGVSTYRADKYGGYDECDQVRKRSIESVLLPATIKKEIEDDLQEFLDSEEWYHDRDIPWRRGYLLEGVPGSGKTSLIRALASEFDLNLYMIPLQEVTDEHLVDLFNRSKNGIVLLEDIDCIYSKRDETGGGATFSGLLNSLDGAMSLDGRIVFMTTNHPEQLDKALIRPGRVDRSFHFGRAKAREIAQMYDRFYPGSKNSKMFGAAVERIGATMAEVQGYLLLHRDDRSAALHNIEDIAKMRKEQEDYERQYDNAEESAG